MRILHSFTEIHKIFQIIMLQNWHILLRFSRTFSYINFYTWYLCIFAEIHIHYGIWDRCCLEYSLMTLYAPLNVTKLICDIRKRDHRFCFLFITKWLILMHLKAIILWKIIAKKMWKKHILDSCYLARNYLYAIIYSILHL